MSMLYIYRAPVFYHPEEITGIDVAQAIIDRDEWEASYEALALRVEEFEPSTPCVYIEKTYQEFKALITETEPRRWQDVLYIETQIYHQLYLLSSVKL